VVGKTRQWSGAENADGECSRWRRGGITASGTRR
jgi:hypothetical protein